MRERWGVSGIIGDPAGGWEAIADRFVAARSNVGAALVRQWARQLPPGGAVVDIGCGAGVPISEVLADAGLALFGIDASATLLAAFRRRFPDAQSARETAEDSRFFGRRFEGAVAVGLIFLLPPEHQRRLIARVGQALVPGGRFLFSAPVEPCEWDDLLTGRRSVSLGAAEYELLLADAGLRLVATHLDEGANHYFDAVRDPA